MEYYAVKDQRFLGEERFIEKLKARVDEEPETARFKKAAMIVFFGTLRERLRWIRRCFREWTGVGRYHGIGAGRLRPDPAAGL